MHDILNFAVNKRFMITAAHISQFSSRFSPTLFFTRSQWQSCIKVNGPVVSCGGEVDKPVEGNRKI